jgi:hypothetical protein
MIYMLATVVGTFNVAGTLLVYDLRASTQDAHWPSLFSVYIGFPLLALVDIFALASIVSLPINCPVHARVVQCWARVFVLPFRLRGEPSPQ